MHMVRMTFSISEELKKKLDKRPDINWSEIFIQGIKKKLKTLEKLQAKGEL
jgi:hypothetical protein